MKASELEKQILMDGLLNIRKANRGSNIASDFESTMYGIKSSAQEHRQVDANYDIVSAQPTYKTNKGN